MLLIYHKSFGTIHRLLLLATGIQTPRLAARGTLRLSSRRTRTHELIQEPAKNHQLPSLVQGKNWLLLLMNHEMLTTMRYMAVHGNIAFEYS